MATPPLRNLSPMSEPWGRWAQEELEDLGRFAQTLGQGVGNDGRAQNSSMDNLSSQISELYARRTSVYDMPDLTTTSQPAPAFGVGTSTVALPGFPDGAPRYGSVSLTATPPPPADPNLGGYYRVTVGSTIIAQGSMNLGGFSTPPGFSPTIRAVASLEMSGTEQIELLCWLTNFTAGTFSMTLFNISVAVTPAQLV